MNAIVEADTVDGQPSRVRMAVSENTPWQPPSSNASSAPTPFAGGEQPQPTTASGWTPPPKPGLIPLRPLTLGTMLAASFQVLRRNPRPVLGVSLVLNLVIALVSLLASGYLTYVLTGRFDAATTDPENFESFWQIMLGSLIAGIVPAILSIIVLAILQGVVSVEVARGTLGEKLRFRALWAAARGRIGALIGWALMLTAGSFLAVFLVLALIALIAVSGGAAGAVAAVLLAIVAFLGGIVILFWLYTRLALVPTVLIIERLPLRAAVVRGWKLTIGYFWKTLGIMLLVAVILSFVASIAAFPFQIALMMVFSTVTPTGAGYYDSLDQVFSVVMIGSALITALVGAVTAVVQSANVALIYIDLRMRKEGLDLELSRFVEARQAGRSDGTDPYLPKGEANAVAAGPAQTAESPWS